MKICEECGDPIDPREGVTLLFDGEHLHIYHHTCAPPPQLIRKIADFAAAQREIQMMSQLGPETYFALKGTNE